MAVPFSNTKLRVPTGFQSLLTGLSTEVLRSQPRNIHHFAAEYFEKLVERRAQGHGDSTNRQGSADDRYYNNRSFREEYPVNDRRTDAAATRIQAQFRGQQTRQELQQSKENKHSTDEDDDHEEQNHERDQATSRASMTDDHRQIDDNQLSTRSPSSRPGKRGSQGSIRSSQSQESNREFRLQRNQFVDDEEEKEEIKRSSSRASSQKLFPQRSDSTGLPEVHGYYENTLLDPNTEHSNAGSPENNDREQDYQDRESDSEVEDHHNSQDLREDESYRPTDDNTYVEENMMDETNRNKAATRIQASFRGYKTRKQLGSDGYHQKSRSPMDHRSPSISPQMHDKYNSPRNLNVLSPTPRNNESIVDEDGTTIAATKIQAAYRGYRTRQNLKK